MASLNDVRTYFTQYPALIKLLAGAVTAVVRCSPSDDRPAP